MQMVRLLYAVDLTRNEIGKQRSSARRSDRDGEGDEPQGLGGSAIGREREPQW